MIDVQECRQLQDLLRRHRGAFLVTGNARALLNWLPDSTQEIDLFLRRNTPGSLVAPGSGV